MKGLPESLIVNGSEYAIRTDFRDVLTIISAFSDPELENSEKVLACLYILYVDFDTMRSEDYQEAFEQALLFLNNGMEDDGSKRSPHILDWEQDEKLIFPAINKVAGCETRTAEYIHWWTFLGYFMEISEGVFSYVLSLRTKKAKGKKLEKWDREYWTANKDICVLKPRRSVQEQQERENLLRILK